MDGLEVFGLDAEPGEARMAFGLLGDVAHEVLNEDGIVVGGLGDEFFIGTLQQAVKLGAGGGFDELDEVFDPHGLAEAHGEGDDAALIVGTAGADGLRAGTKRGHGHFDGQNEVAGVLVGVHFKDDAIVEQTLSTGDGRFFGAEVGEAELDVSFVGVELFDELLRHASNGGRGKLGAVCMQHLDKTAHVRAFVLMRQVNSEGHSGHGVLHGVVPVPDAEREAQAAHAHAVNGELPVIAFALGVCEGGHGESAGETKIPLLRMQQWDQDDKST